MTQPAIYGIMTDDTIPAIRQDGCETLCIDATFRVTKEKLICLVIMVLDKHKRGVPVAFFFISPTVVDTNKEHAAVAQATYERCFNLFKRRWMSSWRPR